MIYIIYNSLFYEINGTLINCLDYFVFLNNHNLKAKLLVNLEINFFYNIINNMYKKELINNLEIINIKDNFEYSLLIKNNDIIIIHYFHYLRFYQYFCKNIKKIIIHSTSSYYLKEIKKMNLNEYHFNEDNLIKIPFKHTKYIKKIYLDGLDINRKKIYNFDIFINYASYRGILEKEIFEKLIYDIIKDKSIFIYYDNKDKDLYNYLYDYSNITIFNNYINMNEFNFDSYLYVNYINHEKNIPDNSCRNIIIMKYLNKNIIYLNPFNIKDGAYYRYLDNDIEKYKLTINDEIVQNCLFYDLGGGEG